MQNYGCRTVGVGGLRTDIRRRGRRPDDPRKHNNNKCIFRTTLFLAVCFVFVFLSLRVVGAPTPTNIISNRNRPSTPTIHLKSNLLTLEDLLSASVDAVVLARPGNDGLVMIRIGALGMRCDLSVELPYIINGRQNADGAK